MFLVDVQRDETSGEFLSGSSVYSFGGDPILLGVCALLSVSVDVDFTGGVHRTDSNQFDFKIISGHGDEEAKDQPTLIEDLEGHGFV